ncbi:LysR family transcriptional regulator [Kitasatospora sp. NPDC051914]|uniref:LysR family transcriptional regulator n=1 Tax=Kitasatospora sp. NPDC051914 TaxID=3154945 RepID=UPI0034258079
MELQHLRSFLEVSSEMSFTRAAKKLNYAQSSVTAQIQHLEASLGAVLFDRRGRRIALTESGLRLRPVAERIVALADLAHREVAGAADRHSGRAAERPAGGGPALGRAAAARSAGMRLPAQRGTLQLTTQRAPRAGSSTSQEERTRVIRSSSSRTDPR